MRFTTFAAIVSLVTLELVVAVPSGYTSSSAQPFKKVYLRRVPCGQQNAPCYHNARTFVLPSAPVAKVPLLRQVFTTVTQKHDNVNTAHAESGKGLDVKYQAGPSLELEGSTGASEYTRLKGAEHLEDSSPYPYVYTQPNENVEYLEPVEETQCVEDCANETEQFTEPVEETQCSEDCA
ncbi:hypothetical protein K493DRAFT_302904 [Basidiobolus meristosporus CBS 931.73]|uniref:Uncharacterized protein n=1 Tax=Basidiobolus meristosporus CBS 931.73 TaxID=1314790 RepID=A0A1Y1Y542_9FUNG|nr:hypothetical protein K493DRAFT_302904 [Basidiobolus meristosporus CBS 931.73]|eukprot:ORX93103.1 hypothetical protein K493DRAFT_302904 [Basidiobolus meristosporus CBS 931.73]